MMHLKTAVLVVILMFTAQSTQRRPASRYRDIRGQIRGSIRSDTYVTKGNVTKGSASLAFVFDVTGSMWDDLKQVIAGAKQIMDTTLGRTEKPLHNYVLVPFHDPSKYLI